MLRRDLDITGGGVINVDTFAFLISDHDDAMKISDFSIHLIKS